MIYGQYTFCWACDKPMLIEKAPDMYFTHMTCSIYCRAEMLEHYQ